MASHHIDSMVKKILSLETFSLSWNSMSLSPDGHWLSFVTKSQRRRFRGGNEFLQNGFQSAIEGSEVWLVGLQNGESRNLTPDWGTSWGPSWSPNSEGLTFYSDRDGTVKLWMWDARLNKLRPVTDEVIWPCLCQDITSRWTHDATRIVVKLRPEDQSPTEDDPVIVDGDGVSCRVYKNDPSSPPAHRHVKRFERVRADLGIVAVATGKCVRLRQEFPPTGLTISPDDVYVAIASLRGFETAEMSQEIYDLNLVPLDGNSPTRLVEGVHFRGAFGPLMSWSPDGTLLAYSTYRPRAKGDVVVVSVADGGQQNLTADTGANFSNMYVPPLWSEDCQHLYSVADGHLWRICVADGVAVKMSESLNRIVLGVVHRREDAIAWMPGQDRALYVQTFDYQTKKSGFYRLRPPDDVECLIEGDQLYNRHIGPDAARESDVFCFISEDQNHPADAWKAEIPNGKPVRLTKLNPYLDDASFGESVLVDWRTPKGRKLKGTLLLPPDYQQNEMLPLVTKVYGGVSMSNMINHFGHADNQGATVDNMHILASVGFAVFRPDLPMDSDDRLGDLVEATLSGIDAVINMGYADPDRLGVMGHSFGGYCVNVLITRTSRFKAAVSGASICNLTSAYGALNKDGDANNIANIKSGQYRMVGSLWDNRDHYLEGSPFFYLDRVETPLLLYHGELDQSCPITEAEMMFSGLRQLGKEVVLVRYADEGHWPGSWRYSNAVDLLDRIIKWFSMHLFQ